jgi:hypothetical protein
MLMPFGIKCRKSSFGMLVETFPDSDVRLWTVSSGQYDLVIGSRFDKLSARTFPCPMPDLSGGVSGL